MKAISRMKLAMVAVGACVLVFPAAQAEEEKKAGIGITNYPGNTPRTEKDEALKLKGNWQTGQKY